MVVVLEGVRRFGREYDRSIRAAHVRLQSSLLPLSLPDKGSDTRSVKVTPFWCVSFFHTPFANK